ncbi:MAG: hypothetical protein JZU63_12360, partial [Rhodoferax sp.]|nr:hypothetical protein [Rhodoferax sp.]
MTGFSTSGKRASNGYHMKKKGKKGKNNKQNDSRNNQKANNKPITVVSNRKWSMMPSPKLSADLILKLKFERYAPGNFTLANEIYAYEAHCTNRPPYSYYVQIPGGSKYIAYVAGAENLTKTGQSLREDSGGLTGYIYHSTVIPYHETGSEKTKHGYITFMILFKFKSR